MKLLKKILKSIVREVLIEDVDNLYKYLSSVQARTQVNQDEFLEAFQRAIRYILDSEHQYPTDNH